MKSNFLENWIGKTNSFRDVEKFKRADGSSLTPTEKDVVKNGGIAFHKKGSKDTKVFVVDENQNMWSVTVFNPNLTKLKLELKEVGYILPSE